MNILFPHTLTFITTHKCTSACPNCCFGCNPQINRKMSLSNIKKYTDKVLSDFSTISNIVFTGGEVSCLGIKTLTEAIKYCANFKNIHNIRIVTNGIWAKKESLATNFIKKLTDVGLKEINLSTGDEHLQYVPIENILMQ